MYYTIVIVHLLKSIMDLWKESDKMKKQPTFDEFKDNLLAILDIINNN